MRTRGREYFVVSLLSNFIYYDEIFGIQFNGSEILFSRQIQWGKITPNPSFVFIVKSKSEPSKRFIINAKWKALKHFNAIRSVLINHFIILYTY